MTPGREGAPTKGERTRARLVDVAARVFTERGYAATTFGDLIEAAGVSKGAFYFHFQSKEQLALAVLQDVKGRHLDAVRDRLTGAGDPATALREAAAAFAALHGAEPAALGLAHDLAATLAASPELREEAAAVTRRWLDLLAGFVADARLAAARADADPETVARLVFAAVDGARRLTDALDPPAERQAAFVRQLDLLVTLLENALLPLSP